RVGDGLGLTVVWAGFAGSLVPVVGRVVGRPVERDPVPARAGDGDVLLVGGDHGLEPGSALGAVGPPGDGLVPVVRGGLACGDRDVLDHFAVDRLGCLPSGVPFACPVPGCAADPVAG